MKFILLAGVASLVILALYPVALGVGRWAAEELRKIRDDNDNTPPPGVPV